jgi:hypothetical protein
VLENDDSSGYSGYPKGGGEMLKLVWVLLDWANRPVAIKRKQRKSVNLAFILILHFGIDVKANIKKFFKSQLFFTIKKRGVSKQTMGFSMTRVHCHCERSEAISMN